MSAGAGGALLALSAVTVRREGAVLLGGVHWEVRPGESWVVLGSNGAGKTTLLRVAAGLEAPGEGVVHLLGERLDHGDREALAALRPRVGLASASVGDEVPPGTAVADVVASAALDRLDRGDEPLEEPERRRARRMVVEVGARALLDRPWGSLSEGERRRVLVARALMTDPELLLVDEPAAGLDLGAREALLRRLSRVVLHDDEPALVLVTHVLEEVPAGVTHALLLRRGAVIASGPVERVLTAELVGAAYGLPLVVEHRGGRWSARVAPPRRRPRHAGT